MAEAARRGLQAPTYEDALYFGIAHPDAQREAPIVFLHEPWVGYFDAGRALSGDKRGRRELGWTASTTRGAAAAASRS
jgi:hypothetical protein